MASPKILIVEDFEDLRNLVSFYLCARGYDVLEAPTGRAAIEIAITGNPNLVLLDLRLPDINGVEIAQELRKLPQTKHIPILAWTADCRSKPAEEVWRRAGISDCLEKPVSMRELEAAIERLFQLCKLETRGRWSAAGSALDVFFIGYPPCRLNLSAQVDKLFFDSALWRLSMENEPDSTPFLTPRQAAKLLNLPIHRVLKMIHRKELPALKVGAHWRIPKSEVTKLIPPSN